ncbi:MAG: alanine racemase, partial [Cyclobacteriaceae bacterium]|nr:alanine racemase [Cyclobacteriaceae bacterium]
DLAGLRISLDFLKNQQKPFKTLILSDVLQTGLPDAEVVAGIHQLVLAAGVKRFIGIGPVLQEHGASFPFGEFYRSTNDFLRQFQSHDFADQVVLVKGARPFQFEKIVKRLERKVHGTVMEVDLNAMVHNLNYFKSRLKPGTRLMAMVKAFAYGSGSEEVANLLQYHRVDYLGVAYADEGIELRKNNISLPIMVMNPTEESFPSLLEFDLEPEIYSKRIFNSLVHFLEGRPCQVHLKLDTGMHRLGFEEDELDEVFALFQANKNITVASVMSHLAGADESLHDDFSKQQADAFLRMNDRIASSLGYQPIRHLLNSPGILRLSQYQFDMVRLGIGLYGVDPTEEGKADLRPVATLKTIISQIKKIKAGDTIGYGRKGKALHDMTLATLAIGYADGFSRAFSRGKGSVLINGQRAPVVGNVCMDMTMVDITGIAAREGDEAIIFGAGLPIQQVARWIDTIPYEFLTSTSERVKRAFYAEGI